MAPELALGGLQRWLQTVIEAPGTVRAALRSPEAVRLVRTGRAREVVLPSWRGLSASDRVGVYQAMYLPRMQEALESDYPGLAHFLGPASWTRLVRAYLLAHPSRSYTLNELGRRLPEFARSARVPRPAFCHDLARLERAVSEVFDAHETRRLGGAELTALAPRDLERSRLVPAAAVRLLALDHDAGAWLDSLKGDAHRHPTPSREPTRLVVYRRNYAVLRRTLDAAAFALLRDLVAGRPVGRALERALRRRGAARLAGAEAAFRLFRDWAAMGLFQAMETKRAATGARRGSPGRSGAGTRRPRG
jgi:hypothetical protein